jgi:hypothetical protein
MLSTSPLFRFATGLGRPRALAVSMQRTTRPYPVADGPVEIGRDAPKWSSAARRALEYTATVALGLVVSYWILWGFGR